MDYTPKPAYTPSGDKFVPKTGTDYKKPFDGKSNGYDNKTPYSAPKPAPFSSPKPAPFTR